MMKTRKASHLKDNAGQIFWKTFSKHFYKAETEFKQAIEEFMEENHIDAEVDIEDLWISFGDDFHRLLEKNRNKVEHIIDMKDFSHSKTATINTPQVGDIVVSHTMYGGWYNYFYEVIGIQKGLLVLQEIDTVRKYDEYDSGTELPKPSVKLGQPFKARWNGSSVKVPAGRSATLWDGKALHFQSMD
jgi:hypothetical protein